MRAAIAALVLSAMLTACASSRLDLPYKPEVQPSGATLSAAYTIVGDRLRVEIATDGQIGRASCRERVEDSVAGEKLLNNREIKKTIAHRTQGDEEQHLENEEPVPHLN